MTFDQKIAVWNAAGAWVAGIATLLAVLVSLHLARKSEQIRIKGTAGLRLIFTGDGTPAEEHLQICVMNHGERIVTGNSVGWRVGKKSDVRFCVQPVSGKWTQDYPKQLAHGEQACFLVSFKATLEWPTHFAKTFVRDVSDKNLKTLRALVYTSLGQTIEVTPASGVLQKLRETAV